MFTRFVIRLQTGVINDTAPVAWHNNQSLNAEPQYGELSDAIAEYKKLKSNVPLFVALPASVAPETVGEINAAQKRKINQVLPFLFEDKVAEDIEDVHFAINQTENTQCRVCYINKSYLESILDVFKKHDVNIHWLGAEVQLLRENMLDEAILVDAEQIIVKHNGALRTLPHSLKSAVQSILEPQVAVPSLSETVLDTEGDNVTNIEATDSSLPTKQEQCAAAKISMAYFTQDIVEEKFSVLRTWAEENGLTIKRLPSFLSQLASKVPALQAGNLLSGDYSAFRHSTGGSFPWKAIAAIAAFFVIAFSVLNIAEGMRYKTLEADAIAQQKALYVELFPEAKNAKSNFKVRMQSKLNEMNIADSGESEGTFAEIFDKTSQVVAKQQDADLIFVEQARYNNSSQKVDIVITAKSLEQLDTLKNALDEKGLDVAMGSAVNTEKGTRVKFTIGKLAAETV